MINIVCLKWGTKYSTEYVWKLKRALARNVTVPYTFTCFTDDTSLEGECNTILLQNLPIKTWFNKLQMFYLDMYLPGADQIFFFDLDTVITGNIDELLDYRGDFAILRDFYRNGEGKFKNRPAGYGSAIMSWKPETKREWWDKFVDAKYPMDRLGDQGLMEKYAGPSADTWQDMFPNQIYSYKIHCMRVLPPDTRIVCFHGRPPPHKVNTKWMTQHWK